MLIWKALLAVSLSSTPVRVATTGKGDTLRRVWPSGTRETEDPDPASSRQRPAANSPKYEHHCSAGCARYHTLLAIAAKLVLVALHRTHRFPQGPVLIL